MVCLSGNIYIWGCMNVLRGEMGSGVLANKRGPGICFPLSNAIVLQHDFNKDEIMTLAWAVWPLWSWSCCGLYGGSAVTHYQLYDTSEQILFEPWLLHLKNWHGTCIIRLSEGYVIWHTWSACLAQYLAHCMPLATVHQLISPFSHDAGWWPFLLTLSCHPAGVSVIRGLGEREREELLQIHSYLSNRQPRHRGKGSYPPRPPGEGERAVWKKLEI